VRKRAESEQYEGTVDPEHRGSIVFVNGFQKCILFDIVSGDDDKIVGEDVTKFEDQLKQANVQHVYTLLPGGTHTMFVWRPALYSFLQQIFKH
jgi:S-formylglutathione hydrolase FrmB